MKATNLERSFTLISINNNNFYYSYGTLVAINNTGTIEKFSKTTSKHVNKHCNILTRIKHEDLEKIADQMLNNIKEPNDYLMNIYK